MGLLDYLNPPNAGNGVGGLLSYLNSPLYQSPLLAPQQPAPQPQYDAMGNYTGLTPQADSSPFGLPPNFNPQDYQPKTPFTVGTAPVAGLPSFAPQQPAPQPAQPSQPTPAPQPASQPADTRTINIGGYQMPQVGHPADFTPQAPTDMSARARGPAQQPDQALPPALSSQSSGFSGALQGFMGNAHNGPIGMLLGGIGGAMGMEGAKQQNLRAQYNALVPLVGPQKALLSVMNPEAGKTILQEALSNKEKFVDIGPDANGVMQKGFVDETSQTVKPYKTPGGEVPGFVTGPDGKLIPIPPGVDPKTFRNEVSRANAKAAAGEKTEVQAKAEIFANKMETAEKTIAGLEGQGTSLAGKIASGVPLGNYVQSPEYQRYKQASSNFITALLRQESGAAISKSEFDRYDKEYMPQPGDSRAVLDQKAEARKVAIEGMKKGAGPGYKSPAEASGGAAGPAVGAVQMGYRFRGGNPADRNSWEKVQ